MSTQVTTATQVGTVGVDEVLGEPGSPNRPAPRSLQARRPSSRRVLTRTLLVRCPYGESLSEWWDANCTPPLSGVFGTNVLVLLGKPTKNGTQIFPRFAGEKKSVFAPFLHDFL